HLFSHQLQPRVAVGERGVIDADVRIGMATDQAWPLQREAAAVEAAADAAQDHAQVGHLVGRTSLVGGAWQLYRLRRQQAQLDAVDIGRIASAAHRRALRLAAVHVDAGGALLHVRPDPAAVDAQPRRQSAAALDHVDTAGSGAADAVHADRQRTVVALLAGDLQSDGFHGAAIYHAAIPPRLGRTYRSVAERRSSLRRRRHVRPRYPPSPFPADR